MTDQLVQTVAGPFAECRAGAGADYAERLEAHISPFRRLLSTDEVVRAQARAQDLIDDDRVWRAILAVADRLQHQGMLDVLDVLEAADSYLDWPSQRPD